MLYESILTLRGSVGLGEKILLKSGGGDSKIMEIMTFGICPKVGSHMETSPVYFLELQESYKPETFISRSVMVRYAGKYRRAEKNSQISRNLELTTRNK